MLGKSALKMEEGEFISCLEKSLLQNKIGIRINNNQKERIKSNFREMIAELTEIQCYEADEGSIKEISRPDAVLKNVAPQVEYDIQEYAPVIRLRVQKALGSGNPDSEDLVAQILSTATKKIKAQDLRRNSSVGTFLYEIASRKIIDYIRHSRIALENAKKILPELPANKGTEYEERAEKIAMAMEELKPKYKEVLYLYYYKKMSRKEVARMLGISSSLLNQRLCRGRRLLRRLIEG